MKQDSSSPADEARLHALVDGRLDAQADQALRAQLDADPQAARQVQAWQQQREQLRGLHAHVLHEPVPTALTQAARNAGKPHVKSVDGWRLWGGIAASALLAFVTGWLAHAQWGDAGVVRVVRMRPIADFGRQAVVAHRVYAPEVRHPVEVPAAEHEHLVQWLSKRIGRPLKVPDLSAQGYALVGGRLLPGDQGARAQFMYQNARAERITLYVGAVEPGREGAAPSGETAFSFTSQGDASGFYWVDQGYGYALAGRLGRTELLALANDVYRQL